ncbi:MAG: response regulator [Candidatus Borkfalkiaceae bacterium]|nr:response regulator [Clostridia bacterium]MDY6222578.1 response regulator [Christensenellaceae bacterium]
MNILVLDDERLALAGLIREIKTVFPLADIKGLNDAAGAEAFAKSLKESGGELDYAFCDVELPETNGIEAAKMLKTYFPKVRLFFCTAYSRYAIDAFGLKAKGYLLKPVRAKDITDVLDEMVEDWKDEQNARNAGVRVKTFGDFEVFVNGKPLKFSRAKAKELFAYLIDRNGAGVTTERIAAVLFENENYDKKLKNAVTRTVSFLKADLKAAGIGNVLVQSWNQLAIDPAAIKCDAYDFEKGDPSAINAYRGEYMYAYSWAEFSTGRFEAIMAKRK